MLKSNNFRSGGRCIIPDSRRNIILKREFKENFIRFPDFINFHGYLYDNLLIEDLLKSKKNIDDDK